MSGYPQTPMEYTIGFVHEHPWALDLAQTQRAVNQIITLMPRPQIDDSGGRYECRKSIAVWLERRRIEGPWVRGEQWAK